MVEPSKTYRAWFLLSVYNSFQSNLVEVDTRRDPKFYQTERSVSAKNTPSSCFCEKPRLDLGPSRDMQNRLVDDEETSAQRCFYHDAVLPINEESGRTKSGTLLAQLSNDAKSPAGTARWA